MKYQAIGEFVAIKAILKRESKRGIILPDQTLQMRTANERKFIVEYTEVISKGDKVKNVEVGDKCTVQSYVFNNTLPLDIMNVGIKKDDSIQYFWCLEKDIVGIIK